MAASDVTVTIKHRRCPGRNGNDVIATMTSYCCCDVTVAALPLLLLQLRRRQSVAQTESAEGTRVAERASAAQAERHSHCRGINRNPVEYWSLWQTNKLVRKSILKYSMSFGEIS